MRQRSVIKKGNIIQLAEKASDFVPENDEQNGGNETSMMNGVNGDDEQNGGNGGNETLTMNRVNGDDE
ncbi:putative amino acid transporter [Sesbania bispinosa]|nr:putative amino acid transporter [Sesbania bispinosa]